MIAPPKPSARDDLEALIREARARQRRRRLLAGAGIAIAAALALSAYALTTDRGRRQSGTGSGRDAAPASCRSEQLVGTTFLQAATMSGVGAVTIKNASADACLLPRGTPAVQITWRGRTLRVREHEMGWQGQPVHLLQPGATAAVPLLWSNWCGRPQRMARLVFYAGFPNNLKIRAPEERLTGHPACNIRSAPSLLGVGAPIRS